MTMDRALGSGTSAEQAAKPYTGYRKRGLRKVPSWQGQERPRGFKIGGKGKTNESGTPCRCGGGKKTKEVHK